MKKKPRLRFYFLLLTAMFHAANSHASIPDGPHPIVSKSHLTHRLRPGDFFIANLEADSFLQAELRVEYANGKVLMHKPFVLDPGTNAVKFSVSEIPSGFYVVRVLEPHKTETFTIVVH